MKLRRTLVPLVAAAAALALGPAAGAQAVTIAQPGAATQVREHAGIVVFSQFDYAEQVWRLAVRRPGQPAQVLANVAPSQAEFQADIGPDSSGDPQLIYRRSQGTGTSDLFVYSLVTNVERPVRNANDPSADDTTPTLWRGRIAWTRVYHAGDPQRQDPVVYTKTLTAPRSRPSTRLPGVPQRRCGDVETDQCGPTSSRYVGALELWGRNLAQTVGYSCAGCSGTGQSELRLVETDTLRARQIAFTIVGLSGQSLVGPSFHAGTLGWYRACQGDPDGCKDGRRGPARFALGSGAYAIATGDPVAVRGYVDAGATLLEVLGCEVETQAQFNGQCRIEEVPAPETFTKADPPLRGR
jgi:hypothetical protein